jgi:hypothetical protein
MGKPNKYSVRGMGQFSQRGGKKQEAKNTLTAQTSHRSAGQQSLP